MESISWIKTFSQAFSLLLCRMKKGSSSVDSVLVVFPYRYSGVDIFSTLDSEGQRFTKTVVLFSTMDSSS